MADETLQSKSGLEGVQPVEVTLFDIIEALANPDIGPYTRQWFAEQMANALLGRPIAKLPTTTPDSTAQE